MSIRGILANLDRVSKAIEADATRPWRKVGNRVQADARANLLKPSEKTKANTWPGANQRRGLVTKSVKFVADSTGVVVGTDSDVGLYQEFGTEVNAPHTIKAKNKKSLRFPVAKGTGMKPSKNGKFDWVFVRAVRYHPGVPAKHWLQNASIDSKDFIAETVGNDAAFRIEASIKGDSQ